MTSDEWSPVRAAFRARRLAAGIGATDVKPAADRDLYSRSATYHAATGQPGRINSSFIFPLYPGGRHRVSP